jgi:hypothetical protein
MIAIAAGIGILVTAQVRQRADSEYANTREQTLSVSDRHGPAPRGGQFGGGALQGLVDAEGSLAWEDANVRQTYLARSFSEVLVLDEYPSLVPTVVSEGVMHSGVAGFSLYSVASATLDKYCVGGFGRDGDFILERWELVPATEASRSGPFSQPLQLGLNGEVLSKDFVKTRLFKGPLGESLVSIGFDPERRFILAMLDGQGVSTIYKFDNVQSATPSVVYSSTAHPELLTLGHFNRMNHVGSGMRVWTISSRELSGDLRMMMFDVDNNGVFDGVPLVGSSDYFAAAGFPMTIGVWNSLDGTGY